MFRARNLRWRSRLVCHGTDVLPVVVLCPARDVVGLQQCDTRLTNTHIMGTGTRIRIKEGIRRLLKELKKKKKPVTSALPRRTAVDPVLDITTTAGVVEYGSTAVPLQAAIGQLRGTRRVINIRTRCRVLRAIGRGLPRYALHTSVYVSIVYVTRALSRT